MGLFKNLDAEKASAAQDRNKVIQGLKPVGMYRVKVEKVTFFGDSNKTPMFSFLLRIVGLLNNDGTFASKKSGERVYAGATEFFRAFVSNEALFGLQNMAILMGYEGADIPTLVGELSSLTTKLKAEKWAMSWVDTRKEFNVWVSHDIKEGFEPKTKVSISKVQP